jgi:hypothetical protein
MARLLDRLSDINSKTPRGVYTWAQRVCEQIEAAFARQQTQITALENLNSDDVLTPAKKPQWILFNSFLTGEQTGLDAEATAYGITTEKTAYDAAQTALSGYLATLTAAVAWDDLTGDTAITGTTFRSKFNDVLVAKQALLNAMHGSAKALADNAQSTATTAKKNDAISASWTSPGSILSATDAGTSATVTIASHTRKYGDSSSVPVTGASLTGLPYSAAYYIYYDDNNHAGGAVTFVATTNPNTAAYNSATGRHYCGSVVTPASGGGSTSGGTLPPGGGYTGPGAIP